MIFHWIPLVVLNLQASQDSDESEALIYCTTIGSAKGDADCVSASSSA